MRHAAKAQNMRRKVFGILAGLLLGAPACAQQWFSVSGPGAGPDDTVVEIDLDTVRIRQHGGEGVIRVTFDVMQAHGSAGFAYRSIVATTQLDCVRRTILLTSAAYYALPAAQGPRIGVDSSGREAGMPPDLLDKIPSPARQALLRATCTAN
jgi:hypothetical protein